MAVYPKLSLSSGGGIISRAQQADQVKNTATVLIGLGGTGIDALRTIKTQVYNRLKPDDPKAVTPEYAHIRFLGVDTAEMNGNAPGANQAASNTNTQNNLADMDVMMLDSSEFFSIAHPNVRKALQSGEGIAIRHELDWLRWEDIPTPNLSKAGAGGIRQVGRFMMMDKSDEFMIRLKSEIDAAKYGLQDPQVNIHIFTGLSGGTGAGCFLDACYMVRKVAEKAGSVTIFGYFFLPDVNLQKIPTSDQATRDYIPQNGYASMQELDYCMNLQYNGGVFVQEYRKHERIEWKEGPVDMAHLICATDAQANVLPDAYDYAMNVTAEYLMDFLTDSQADSQNQKKFDLSQQLANFTQKVGATDAKKNRGYNLSYCVLGAACAYIPLREINTYLASKLFEQFSVIREHVPSQRDVEGIAIRALAKGAEYFSDVYDYLLRELRENAEDDYDPYPNDWKDVRDHGCNDFLLHYSNQTAGKLGQLEANAKKMTDQKNRNSLLGRLRSELELAIRDIDRGPAFAYRALTKAQDHNLLNLIDGLIEQNLARWQDESAQEKLRKDDYGNAKANFEDHCGKLLAGLNAKKYFETYEWYLKLLEQHGLLLNVYAQMDTVLKTLRKQVEEITGGYYAKLSRVMGNLIETFEKNRTALATSGVLKGASSFATPMMTIAELKTSLDARVAEVSARGMLDAFVGLLLEHEHEEDWITENENKITRLVTDFFVETFADFAGRSITDFLEDKYGTTNAGQLANYVYNVWVDPLTKRARPLFYFNNDWPESNTSRLSFISIPTDSAPIVAAVGILQKKGSALESKSSALTDRIYVMSSACALPLSAYDNCQAYERDCFSSETPGRHYYEGKPVEGMRFDDWRKLPSLTPQSLLDLDTAPVGMRDIIRPAKELFERAVAFDLIDSQSHLCAPKKEALEERKALIQRCHTLAETVRTPEDAAAARALLAELTQAGKISVEPTRYAMRNDGHVEREEDKRRIQKDYFVSSPVLQLEAKESLAKLEKLRADADSAAKALQDAIDRAEKGTRAMNAYCDALFTGVLSLEGRVLLYRESQYGVTSETVLSKRDEAFPFGSIPVYQGFLSYQALPEELRAAMSQKANDRLNADAPEIRETCGKLREALRDDQVNAWAQLAASFPQRGEIVAFLGTLKQRFQIFCLENAVN